MVFIHFWKLLFFIVIFVIVQRTFITLHIASNHEKYCFKSWVLINGSKSLVTFYEMLHKVQE